MKPQSEIHEKKHFKKSHQNRGVHKYTKGSASDPPKVITPLGNGKFLVQLPGFRKVFHNEQDLQEWKAHRSFLHRQEKAVKQLSGDGVAPKAAVCFRCRQSGHQAQDCPLIQGPSEEPTVNKTKAVPSSRAICFHCGSTEHNIYRCTEPPERQTFKFATCFVCNLQGHLSKNCPKNDKGLYPNGGACLLCNGKDHLKKDCPTKKQQHSTKYVSNLVKVNPILKNNSTSSTTPAVASADYEEF